MCIDAECFSWKCDFFNLMLDLGKSGIPLGAILAVNRFVVAIPMMHIEPLLSRLFQSSCIGLGNPRLEQRTCHLAMSSKHRKLSCHLPRNLQISQKSCNFAKKNA